ncbi:hypothetical protein GUITHDRAFT_152739 [Guillardia theta CCMP2712]|uniref:Uncharacterized protein n=1 Tax=Guillardia theta (strain CCMP2712) TaxID=905079 RepID=L1JB12_GUITC|nr:hypothetical protein GUITHDRAFT_152739 [Guillardia theta CCMP2712]EKX45512.1 hypothetical protein GUITHDRAFT_152739 [Guillardia theta CCMP2712]|eukprot:XP_005832492.1 hypothetical protein GUITHDRAFT_152739 [Guillardia theta CCMP2712]
MASGLSSVVKIESEEASFSPHIRIHNVVALARIKGPLRLDTRLLARKLKNVQYRGDLKNCFAVTFWFKDCSASATVFDTGSIRLAGAKSESAALTLMRRVVRRIARIIEEVRGFDKFRLVNTIGGFETRGFIDRERSYLSLARKHPATYEPELATGIKVKLEWLKVTVRIQRQSVQIFGAKRLGDLSLAMQTVMPLLVYVQEGGSYR